MMTLPSRAMLTLPNRASDAGPEPTTNTVYDFIYVAEENLRALSAYRDDDLHTEHLQRISMARAVKANMDSIIALLEGKCR